MSTPKECPHGALIEVGPGVDITEAVQRFLADKGVHFTLAICGGADDDNPVLRHIAGQLQDAQLPAKLKVGLTKGLKGASDEYVATIIRGVLSKLRESYRIAVLTGGTKWGVPRIATQVARELGFPTIGVYPLTAKGKHAMSEEMLDLAICVYPGYGKSAWGDESHILTKLLDATIVIGGNAGTMVEVTHVLKHNEKHADLLAKKRALEARDTLTDKESSVLRQIEDELPQHKLRYIVPIYGTGGTADKLSFFPGKPNTMTACIPSLPITTGEMAAAFLLAQNAIPETD